jgi:hypothetical protein
MKGLPAQYMGKIVSKTNFRAYIYKPDGSQKLVNSWDEYEECIASGIWFSTVEAAKERFQFQEQKKGEVKPDVKASVKPVEKKK